MQTPRRSHPSGMTTVAMFQDIVTVSLRDLQASHERELAILHDENLKLQDELADLEKAAGKTLADVLDVAPKVPRITCSNGTIVPRMTCSNELCVDQTTTASAGPQPAKQDDLEQLKKEHAEL